MRLLTLSLSSAIRSFGRDSIARTDSATELLAEERHGDCMDARNVDVGRGEAMGMGDDVEAVTEGFAPEARRQDG